MLAFNKKIKLPRQNIELSAHLTQGQGEPLLCLSGFGCDHYNYHDLAPFLSQDFQLYMLDNRGMGTSQKVQNPYTIKDLALDAVEYMEQEGFKSFHLVGISMGGFIAQTMASLYPNKVKSLSLLCTTGVGSEFIPIPILGDDQLISFYQGDPKEMIAMAVALTTHPQTPAPVKKHIIDVRLEHHEDLQQVLLQRNAVEDFFQNTKIDYACITMPTLILVGEADRFVSPQNADILQSKIPQAQMYKVPQTDHFFFMEKAPEVAQYISSFIKAARKEEL